MLEINDKLILHTPKSIRLDQDETFIFIDPEAPNWIGTDERGKSMAAGVGPS